MEREDLRSAIAPRTAFSRQATSTSSSANTRVLKMVTEMGSHSMSGISPAFSSGAATSLLDARQREKKDMQDLNDRLAGYIEKVRFLEAQNRKLAEDLDKLRGRWGKDTSSIKTMYENELVEARKLIDDTSRDKNHLESQIHRLQTDIQEYRKKYDDASRMRDGDKERIESLSSQLSDAEAEISLLRRRIQHLEDDVVRIKNDNSRLLTELQKTRNDLDQETLNRIDYQNQVQTLLEEIDFLNRVHDQEVKELQAIATKDPTREYREYFKDDLAAAIRDIRVEYDSLAQQNKVDMESWYKLKVQEIQTSSHKQLIESSYSREETKRLRNQLGDLRGKLSELESRNAVLEKQSNELTYQLEDDQRQYEAALNDRDAQIRKMRDECQSLMVELQALLDTKQTLDAEIAIYRKMLEGEENREGLKQLVDQMMQAHTTRQSADEDIDYGEGRQSRSGTTSKSSFREISWSKKTTQEGGDIKVEESYRERPEKGEEGVEHGRRSPSRGGRRSPTPEPEDESESMRVVKGEMATRTSFQRSAKGNVSIAECHPDGKYIVVENTHRSKDENLDGWKLKRTVDNRRELDYIFPPNFILRAGRNAKLWAKNQGGTHNPPDNVIIDEDTWGTGANVQTILYNRDGDEKATHIQRTSQQSTAAV